MPSIVRMPAVAAGATEVVLSEWLVPERGAVATEDAYAVIETDKATVDLEADEAGILLRHLVPAGASVAIGSPIALLAAPGEDVPDLEAALAELGVMPADPAALSFPERREVPEPEAVETPAAEAPAAAGTGSAGTGLAGTPSAGTTPAAAPGRRRFASPLARRLARDAGLGLADLTGTGPGGRVVRRDVETAIAARHRQASPPAAPTTIPTTEPRTGTGSVPHTRIRRAIAQRLTQSKQQAPHFYVRGRARVDRLLALREEIREPDLPVSVNDLVVRAVGRAHRLVPELNVEWTDEAVLLHDRVDVGIAVATGDGLVVPVLRGVGDLPLREEVRAARDLVARAKAGRLGQPELEGGTVSVSNLGMYGVEEFSAIINPPQASILAVGAVAEEVVVEDGAPIVGQVLRVVLSVDHRPVDGVAAARWMREFIDLLEHPARILA